MIGTTSWPEPTVESSREESGEDTVVAASRLVGGADESHVADNWRLICMFDIPSLSAAVLKAFWNLDDCNALSSVGVEGFLASAEDLVAREMSSHTAGMSLYFSAFLGDGRGGSLKLFDEL